MFDHQWCCKIFRYLDIEKVMNAIHKTIRIQIQHSNVVSLHRLGTSDKVRGGPRLLRVVFATTCITWRNLIIAKMQEYKKEPDSSLPNVYVKADIPTVLRLNTTCGENLVDVSQMTKLIL